MNIECSICNKKYNSQQALRNHTNKYHKDAIQEVSQESDQESPQDESQAQQNQAIINHIIKNMINNKQEKTTKDKIIMQILEEESNLTPTESNKISNMIQLVEKIEERFMDEVMKEANITLEEIINNLNESTTEPSNPYKRSSVLGAYIRWLNECLGRSKTPLP